MMALKIYQTLIWTICLTVYAARCAVQKGPPLPLDIKKCFDMANKCQDSVKITDEETYNMCEELFNENKNGGYKIKPEHLVHFKRILENIKRGGEELQNRQKRATYHKCPRRIRKEIRKHSPEEWQRFTSAVNALKDEGTYDSMAAIHRGFPRLLTAHGGPNFLGWHRIYLLLFEDLLREKEPCVALPYWDSTLDYHMSEPIESILWTSGFVGNGNGQVTSGPFGGWVTSSNIPLTRNIGSGGSLISKQDVRRVLRYYNNINADITDLFGRPNDSIELYHNGPHVWVDGHMSGLNSAAEDPMFYMHHAFIDCWWQAFRKKIWRNHGVNSTFDYPQINGLHNGDLPMDPWENITNSEGYADYWGNQYECQRFPRCSKRFRRACRSPYLVCQDFNDRPTARCVSVGGAEPRVVAAASAIPSANDEMFPLQGVTRNMTPQVTLGETPNRPLMPPGPTFQAFKIDNRTLGDPLQRKVSDLPPYRPKRDVSDISSSTEQTSGYMFPSCSAVKDVARLHYSIAYIDPAMIQGSNNEFVYIPIILVTKSNTHIEMTYKALVYGLKYNTRYRVYLHTTYVHNSTVAIVPMLNPELVNLEYMVTVVDDNGTTCQSECLEDPMTQRFGQCTGGITVNTDIPDMYRTTYKDLVNDLNKEDREGTNNWIGRYVFLKFTCE